LFGSHSCGEPSFPNVHRKSHGVDSFHRAGGLLSEMFVNQPAGVAEGR